jgi:subtilisin family serine protease
MYIYIACMHWPVGPARMQPDITAPGVDVIAAYSGAFSPMGWSLDDRRVPYDTLSGTSMACPLVSGIVGLLRQSTPLGPPP